MMEDNIRIRLSVGLIVVAVLHAVLLGVVFTALHPQPNPKPIDPIWQVPSFDPSPAPVGGIEKLAEPAEVDLQAQGELKQQACATGCPPVTQTRVRIFGPRVVTPAVNRTVVSRPTTAPTKPVRPPNAIPPKEAAPKVGPPSKPADTPSANPTASPFADVPASTATISAPAQPPEKKDYQLALFVGTDDQSKRLIEWFDRDPQLVRLRDFCEFQIYTSANALYRSRFADIVPADQFPVVLFQDSSGGHVHAAGRTMIPTTAEELHSDLRQGYELYQQAMQAQKTGAIKARGYSWDDSITPTMSLFSEDCPDGYCPPQQPDRVRPVNRVRDRLFDEARDGRNAFIWASANELATIGLVVVAVFLLGFILIKKGA